MSLDLNKKKNFILKNKEFKTQNLAIFDKEFYKKLYNISDKIDPYEHYHIYGKKNNFLPSESYFYSLYPEFDKNKNLKEMIDYHENSAKRFISKLNSYENLVKETKEKTTALLIHIGNIEIFLDDLFFYKNIIKFGNVDIYITILEEKNITKEEIEKALNSSVNFYKIPNIGFDIGGFIFALNKLNKKYDFIIKSHTKTIGEWRKTLLKIFRNMDDLYKIFENEDIGMIASKEWVFPISDNYEANKYHLEKLYFDFFSKKLVDEFYFVAGTIFIARFSIFENLISKNLFFKLNDENSLDLNWYRSKKVHPYLELKTDEETIDHYLKNKKLYSPNLLSKMKHPETKSRSYRDGMIEHALERFFGILCSEKNMKICSYKNKNLISKFDISFVPIFFPQFHSIPENDNFWGKNFTEWNLIQKTPDEKFGEKIRKPHSDIGYYDLTNLEHRKKITEITDKYEIDAFCIYHYWFGKKIMFKPAELMLKEGHPNKKYFFSWANETWSRRWDGLNIGEVLLEQKYENEEEHFTYLLQFFKSEKYIKINNMPLFAIYRLESDFEKIIQLWNRLAIENGFNGIFFLSTFGHFANSNNLEINGIQGNIEFQPGYASSSSISNSLFFKDEKDSIFYTNDEIIYNEEIYLEKNPDVKEMIEKGIYKTGKIHYDLTGENEKMYRNYKCLKFNTEKAYQISLNHERKSKYRFKGTFMNWNNTPRRDSPNIFVKGTYESFENNLIDIILEIIKDPNPNNNMIIINAWNEWGEGAILEPNNIDDYKYLEIIKKVKNYFK